MNHTFFDFAMQHFSLIDLKTFRAVADEGNLTRGAARVHLSHSTVCARIKGLESSLGEPLFTRSAQGMAVTPAGEIVRQGALRIERDIDGMLRDLEPFVSREAGTLRIVSNYGAAMNFLADGLARFLKAHPDVSISHHRCSSRDVVEAVAEDRADIGLSAFVGDYPGVTFIDYARDDLVVIVSIDSPLAHREALDFAECLNEEFVSLSEHVEMQRFVDERARELGHKLVPKVRVSNQPILFQMAAAGVGIGIASRVAFEAQPHPRTRAVKLTNAWAQRHIRIAIPAQKGRQIRWATGLVEALMNGTNFTIPQSN